MSKWCKVEMETDDRSFIMKQNGRIVGFLNVPLGLPCHLISQLNATCDLEEENERLRPRLYKAEKECEKLRAACEAWMEAEAEMNNCHPLEAQPGPDFRLRRNLREHAIGLTKAAIAEAKA